MTFHILGTTYRVNNVVIPAGDSPGGLGQVAYPHHTADSHHHGIRQRRLYRPGYFVAESWT